MPPRRRIPTRKTAARPRPSAGKAKAKVAVRGSSPNTWIKPQLTRLVDDPSEGSDWLHEIKYDGYRMHARLDGDQIKLLTRTGWTGHLATSARSRHWAVESISPSERPALEQRESGRAFAVQVQQVEDEIDQLLSLAFVHSGLEPAEGRHPISIEST